MELSSSSSSSSSPPPGVIAQTTTYFDPNIPRILPHENMYKIQIGSKLFKISGASLSSDGPSYFTSYFSKFEKENDDMTTDSRTCQSILFIDRSAEIFELIYQHLQGYYIDIKDEVQFTMLIADSMYYNLPRLRKILKNSEYYYTKISDISFKLSKSLFERDGDTFNYFYLTSDTLYVDIEKVIVSRKLIRPPPHSYSFVPRSPHLFRKIVQLLGDAKLTMDDNLRESLIKECKYYRLLNLEQRLIKCKILDDPINNRNEIWLGINDVTKKGLLLLHENNETVQSPKFNEPQKKKLKVKDPQILKLVHYKRPYVDNTSRILTIQIGGPDCYIDIRSKSLILKNRSKDKFESTFLDFLQKKSSIQIDSLFDNSNEALNIKLPIKKETTNCSLTLNGSVSNIEHLFENPSDSIYVKNSLWQIQIDLSISFIPIKLDLFGTLAKLRDSEEYI